jgi:hypothetical protein
MIPFFHNFLIKFCFRATCSTHIIDIYLEKCTDYEDIYRTIFSNRLLVLLRMSFSEELTINKIISLHALEVHFGVQVNDYS